MASSTSPKEPIPRKDKWALILSTVAIVISVISSAATGYMGYRFSKHDSDVKDAERTVALKNTIADFVLVTNPSRSASVSVRFENGSDMPITVTRAAVEFHADRATKRASEQCENDLEQKVFESKQVPETVQKNEGGGSEIEVQWPTDCPNWIPGIEVDITYFGEDDIKREFKRTAHGIALVNASNGLANKK